MNKKDRNHAIMKGYLEGERYVTLAVRYGIGTARVGGIIKSMYFMLKQYAIKRKLTPPIGGWEWETVQADKGHWLGVVYDYEQHHETMVSTITGSTPIEVMKLSTRLQHALKSWNLYTVGDVLKCMQDEPEDFLKIPGMGKKSLEDVTAGMTKLGFMVPSFETLKRTLPWIFEKTLLLIDNPSALSAAEKIALRMAIQERI